MTADDSKRSGNMSMTFIVSKANGVIVLANNIKSVANQVFPAVIASGSISIANDEFSLH